jgi:hypothetical protein
MLTLHVISLVFICTHILYSIYRFRKVDSKFDELIYQINNGVKDKMYKILEEEVSFSAHDKISMFAWNYFKQKLEDTYNAFAIVKQKGKEAFLSDSLFKILQGSTEAEFNAMGLQLAQETIKEIERANIESISFFKSKLKFIDLNDIQSIADLMLSIFRQNVRLCVNAIKLDSFRNDKHTEHSYTNKEIVQKLIAEYQNRLIFETDPIKIEYINLEIKRLGNL